MKSILKRLSQLNDDELASLSEAIDIEMGNRLERIDHLSDSARSRAIARGQSYRRSTGSSAPPIRAIGLRGGRHRAA